MKKRLLSMILAAGMAVMMVAGCGNTESENGKSEDGKENQTEEAQKGDSGLTKITMAGNPFVGLAPFYVAMDKGFFEECGLDFSLVDFDDSSASCSALLSDKVDVAYLTLDAAIIAESQYDEDMLKIISIVDESAGADGILAKNEIASIADLKGKTIGVTINQTSHYLLLQALKSAGISDEDVNMVDMTASDAGVSFISGDLDAAVTWEPYLSNAVNEGAGKIIFSSADAPGSIMDVLAVKAEQQDAEWLEKIDEAVQMGLDYLNAEDTREEAVEIVSKYLQVEPEETEAMLATIKLYTKEEAQEAMKEENVAFDAVNNISDFYLDKKIIDQGVTAEKIFKEK